MSACFGWAMRPEPRAVVSRADKSGSAAATDEPKLWFVHSDERQLADGNCCLPLAVGIPPHQHQHHPGQCICAVDLHRTNGSAAAGEKKSRCSRCDPANSHSQRKDGAGSSSCLSVTLVFSFVVAPSRLGAFRCQTSSPTMPWISFTLTRACPWAEGNTKSGRLDQTALVLLRVAERDESGVLLGQRH